MPPIVSICFDDGRQTAATRGAQILEKYGARGTYFPITSRIGTENEDGVYARWETLQTLQRDGHEIGGHSHTHHPELSEWATQLQQLDLAQAGGVFATHGIIIESFAYPFGRYSERLKGVLASLGYKTARTIEYGTNHETTDRYQLSSFMLERTHGLVDVEIALEQARARASWLVLTFHHIDDRTFISTPPELFEEMVACICEAHLPILPIRDAARFMRAAR